MRIIKITICIVFLLLSLSCVSADENVTADIHEFEQEIHQANDTLNVTEDYVCSNYEMNIDKDITIEGNNHTIFANDGNGVLKVNVSDSSNLIFKNLNFNVKLEFNDNSATLH